VIGIQGIGHGDNALYRLFSVIGLLDVFKRLVLIDDGMIVGVDLLGERLGGGRRDFELGDVVLVRVMLGKERVGF
jgi:hypothetical protein